MAPADRQAMIETMVASLDEKLRANPADREGWMRLVRSYVVLGRADAARATWEELVKRFPNSQGAQLAKQRLAGLSRAPATPAKP